VILFVLSEGFLDPIIETTAKKLFIDNPNQATFIKYSNIILWTSMFGKLIMALLLKPLETFIEEYLLKRAIQQQKKLETA
jgi:hypothetical protein